MERKMKEKQPNKQKCSKILTCSIKTLDLLAVAVILFHSVSCLNNLCTLDKTMGIKCTSALVCIGQSTKRREKLHIHTTFAFALSIPFYLIDMDCCPYYT